jgi:hypothetical protein
MKRKQIFILLFIVLSATVTTQVVGWSPPYPGSVSSQEYSDEYYDDDDYYNDDYYNDGYYDD